MGGRWRTSASFLVLFYYSPPESFYVHVCCIYQPMPVLWVGRFSRSKDLVNWADLANSLEYKSCGGFARLSPYLKLDTKCSFVGSLFSPFFSGA